VVSGMSYQVPCSLSSGVIGGDAVVGVFSGWLISRLLMLVLSSMLLIAVKCLLHSLSLHHRQHLPPFPLFVLSLSLFPCSLQVAWSRVRIYVEIIFGSMLGGPVSLA
jgi:flagellar biosynthesis component FlhA